MDRNSTSSSKGSSAGPCARVSFAAPAAAAAEPFLCLPALPEGLGSSGGCGGGMTAVQNDLSCAAETSLVAGHQTD
jgi:hypothetical protein